MAVRLSFLCTVSFLFCPLHPVGCLLCCQPNSGRSAWSKTVCQDSKLTTKTPARKQPGRYKERFVCEAERADSTENCTREHAGKWQHTVQEQNCGGKVLNEVRMIFSGCCNKALFPSVFSFIKAHLFLKLVSENKESPAWAPVNFICCKYQCSQSVFTQKHVMLGGQEEEGASQPVVVVSTSTSMSPLKPAALLFTVWVARTSLVLKLQ